MYYGPLSTQKHCCIAFNFNSSLCYLDVDLTEKFCRHDTIDACGQTLTQVGRRECPIASRKGRGGTWDRVTMLRFSAI